jgi:hypothetical protein
VAVRVDLGEGANLMLEGLLLGVIATGSLAAGVSFLKVLEVQARPGNCLGLRLRRCYRYYRSLAAIIRRIPIARKQLSIPD